MELSTAKTAAVSDQLFIRRASLFPLGSVPSGADAMLIQNGCIAAIGREAELAGCLAPQVRIIDLAGRIVLPGFIDTHVHLAETGLLTQGVDLSPTETIGQVLDLLAGALPGRESPRLLRAHSLDPSQLKEKSYPGMEQLDAISSQVPIFVLRRDGHSCAVNSAFYRLCDLTEKVLGVEVDPLTGRPTGTLRARALELARAVRYRLTEEQNRGEAIRRACWQAVNKGVTTIHAICAQQDDMDLFKELAGELPVDVVPYLITLDVDLVKRKGLRQIGGDLMVDGSLGSHTAALFEPYADRTDQRGLLYFERKQLVEFVAKADESGLQVAMHAIGDRAVEQLLSVYETVLDRQPGEDHRLRIEHAELLNSGQISRMAEKGVVLAVQPAFEAFWGGLDGMYARRLGRKRALMTNPYRSLVDAGVIIAGGSDSYVTPVDPLAGIAAAVNHPNPRHRLSPEEAVRIFTANGARLCFQEKEKGLLAKGMKADLVILSADPRQTPAQEIHKINIHMVVKAGKVVVGPGPSG